MFQISNSPTPLLILNCDDFGWNAHRDAGILSLFQSSHLKSSSVLINGYNAKNAVSQAKTLGFPLGLHINLTEGIPIRKDIQNNSLLKKAVFQLSPSDEPLECDVFHGKFEIFERFRLGNIEKEHVLKEIQAQVTLF